MGKQLAKQTALKKRGINIPLFFLLAFFMSFLQNVFERRKEMNIIEKARLLAINPQYRLGRPYLALGIMSMVPVPKPGLGTMAVDQWGRLYYDPNLNWSLEETASVIIHEFEHLFRDHAGRGRFKEPDLWNRAADMEINDGLTEEGFPLPESPLLPQTHGYPPGLLAEEYYELLFQERGQNGRSTGEDKEESGREEPSSGQSHGEDKQETQENLSGGGNWADEERPNPLRGRDGSGATGVPEEWELPPEGGEGDFPGIDPAEMGLIRRMVAQEILNAAKTRGDIPAGLLRIAQEILSPKVDWRKSLRTTIRRALAGGMGKDDYTFAKRSTVSLPEVILPGLVGPKPRVGIVVDTSGSMKDEDLSRALGEVRGILSALDEGILISTDAASYAPIRLRRRDLKRLPLRGGGGTDMREGLRALEGLKPPPHLGIVITDGETPWPDRGPPFPVVVVLVGNGGTAPKWAQTIRI